MGRMREFFIALIGILQDQITVAIITQAKIFIFAMEINIIFRNYKIIFARFCDVILQPRPCFDSPYIQ